MDKTMPQMDQHYQEKCACAEDAFCSYIRERSRFSKEEKDYLTRIILSHEISGVLYVSSVLAGWSVVAGIIDAILFPGVLVYAIFHGVVDYKVLTPPLLFLIGNALIKFIYIRRSLGKQISLLDIFVAILPYAGSAYLLKKFLVGDALLRKGVLAFLGARKQEVKDSIYHLFRSRTY